jgi:pimeloyl-ACP methyl ester carboxylesterase
MRQKSSAYRPNDDLLTANHRFVGPIAAINIVVIVMLQSSMPFLNRSHKSALLLLFLCFSSSLFAEEVDLQLSPGIAATASYLAADGDKNPVLILHGFLQTYNFSTVAHLQENLSDSGYPVLAPTLSLGIDRRRQTLGCEALHLHNLDQEVNELKQWVEWLYAKHQKSVVLIAHSAGGKAVTRYLAEYPDAPVAQIILISFSYLAHKDGQKHGVTEQEILPFSLGFCKKYLTTRANFHSYIDWGAAQMINALKQSKHPVSIILGTADKRILPEWKHSLVDAGINIVNIEGANHFFDSTHEFDLFDTVEAVLEGESL